MARSRTLVPAGLMMIALSLPGQAMAQDASPAAAGPQQAGEMLCDVEPRDIDELVAFWFDEQGNPIATPTMSQEAVDIGSLPQGDPVDEATLTEIDQTTRGWVTCFILTGQFARGFNLMTDELATVFGPDVASPNEDTADEVRALLEAQLAITPPAGEEGMGPLPELEGPLEARMLPDGRIGAVWALDGDQVFIYYEQQDGRWLVDDFLDIREVSATPSS